MIVSAEVAVPSTLTTALLIVVVEEEDEDEVEVELEVVLTESTLALVRVAVALAVLAELVEELAAEALVADEEAEAELLVAAA